MANLNNFTPRASALATDEIAGKRGSAAGAESVWTLAILSAALSAAASAATNSTGNATVTVDAGVRVWGAEIAFSGSAGTRIVVLADTNATAGALAFLGLNLPDTAGIVVELRSGSASGTLLATVTTDGTAGRVGIICQRGAAAWNEPIAGAWLD